MGSWPGNSPPVSTVGVQNLSPATTGNLSVRPQDPAPPANYGGYREAKFPPSQHPMPWREATRDQDRRDMERTSYQHLPPQLPSIVQLGDRASPMSTDPVNYPPYISQQNLSQNPQRSHQSFFPPPLLTSESTSGKSTGSSASTSSSLYMTPRTPLEPPHERPVPYASQGSYEKKLPPLPSPQSSLNQSYQPPTGTYSKLSSFSSLIPGSLLISWPQNYHL